MIQKVIKKIDFIWSKSYIDDVLIVYNNKKSINN